MCDIREDTYKCCNDSGILREGDNVKVGPIDTDQGNKFTNTIVSSIHRNRIPCLVVKAGQTATLALENVEKSHLRKVSISFTSLCVYIK